jgi:hypothetical protein
MAKNHPIGDNSRVGAVRQRSQVINPVTRRWVKRDAETGKFIDQKSKPTSVQKECTVNQH